MLGDNLCRCRQRRRKAKQRQTTQLHYTRYQRAALGGTRTYDTVLYSVLNVSALLAELLEQLSWLGFKSITQFNTRVKQLNCAMANALVREKLIGRVVFLRFSAYLVEEVHVV